MKSVLFNQFFLKKKKNCIYDKKTQPYSKMKPYYYIIVHRTLKSLRGPEIIICDRSGQ